MVGIYNSSLTRVQPFFELAFRQDAGWLARLLAVAPGVGHALGDVAHAPGTILPVLLGAHPQGKAARACFEYEVLPEKAFLRWCVRHPAELTWPPGQQYGEETTMKRRALVFDEPPGSEAAQAQALQAIDEKSAGTRAWWRFEGSSGLTA